MSGEIETQPVEIRRALPGEEARAAELIYGAPSREAAGIAGGAERAFALGRGLFQAGIGRTPEDDLWLAFREGRALGVLLARPVGAGSPFSARALRRAAAVVLRLYSLPELVAFLRRVRLRRRLAFRVPEGSYHVAELHVHPEHRGGGLGAALLEHGEALARRRGCARITLTTLLTNPARRLYERHGYVEVARRTVPGYEELTGSPGRVLLEKTL